MILPSPITFYAAAGALVIGAAAGYKVRDWQCDAAATRALEQAVEQRQETQDEVDERSETYEFERDQTTRLGTTTIREVRTIYQDVPAPPVDCAPPLSVIGMLQGSVDHANASASGEPGE